MSEDWRSAVSGRLLWKQHKRRDSFVWPGLMDNSEHTLCCWCSARPGPPPSPLPAGFGGFLAHPVLWMDAARGRVPENNPVLERCFCVLSVIKHHCPAARLNYVEWVDAFSCQRYQTLQSLNRTGKWNQRELFQLPAVQLELSRQN